MKDRIGISIIVIIALLNFAPSSPSEAARRPMKVKKSGESKSAINPRRLPSSVNRGFEYRARIGKKLLKFWVLDRGLRQELIYANNTGSKASRALSPLEFSQLQYFAQAAAELKSRASVNGARHREKNSALAKCPQANLQLTIATEESSSEVTAHSCLMSKSKIAKEMRKLGQVLSMIAR